MITVDNGTRGSVCFWSAVTGKELGRDPHGLGKSWDIDFIVGIVVLLWTAVDKPRPLGSRPGLLKLLLLLVLLLWFWCSCY